MFHLEGPSSARIGQMREGKAEKLPTKCTNRPDTGRKSGETAHQVHESARCGKEKRRNCPPSARIGQIREGKAEKLPTKCTNRPDAGRKSGETAHQVHESARCGKEKLRNCPPSARIDQMREGKAEKLPTKCTNRPDTGRKSGETAHQVHESARYGKEKLRNRPPSARIRQIREGKQDKANTKCTNALHFNQIFIS
ncbi:hypothetical protein [Heyndrickxia vini]|uniref:Uncharacterized protein n=1 Tax=Heyndrickxia vini TaxID=1476025 RepID=A0ABX7E3W9_9BACI|nr:hypothetical protein [Heyndrickxia vini]QQZ09941.1 hypothetical protein I5776_02910 [Heyndrickxia vini]